MKKIVSVVSLLFFSGALLVAQETVKPRAKLVRTAFTGGDFLHVIEEAAIDIKEYAGEPGGAAAVRVCTKEPLPVALTTATANPTRASPKRSRSVIGRFLLVSSKRAGALPMPLATPHATACAPTRCRVALLET